MNRERSLYCQCCLLIYSLVEDLKYSSYSRRCYVIKAYLYAVYQLLWHQNVQQYFASSEKRGETLGNIDYQWYKGYSQTSRGLQTNPFQFGLWWIPFFFLVHECASLQAALRTRFLTKAQLPFHYAL